MSENQQELRLADSILQIHIRYCFDMANSNIYDIIIITQHLSVTDHHLLAN